jgi:enamine deaminase RidA (YjgF/YER057c/UK114 family)
MEIRNSNKKVTSNTEWEDKVGYSRAIRSGNTIHVSGTTATDDQGNVVAPGDPYAQTRKAIQNIAFALQQLNAGLDEVVRTRLYVTDMDHWEAIGKAHGEYFGTIRPASTMVEVNRLIDPDMLVEIEAMAIVNKTED